MTPWPGYLLLLRHIMILTQVTGSSAGWPFFKNSRSLKSHNLVERRGGSLRRILKRAKESSEKIQIYECVQVSHRTEGSFHFLSEGREETCGLYLVGRPDQRVKLTLERAVLDDDCEKETIVLLDGWELNGNVLPSDQDHGLPMENRFLDICGQRSRRKTVLISSQNNAMVQYKIPTSQHGFMISVEYMDNPDPCNILMADMNGVFNFTNNREGRNCSLTTLLFPARLELVELSLGQECQKCGDDYLEVGGSTELSSSKLETKLVFKKPLLHKRRQTVDVVVVLCESTTVRLVSSGKQENSAVVRVRAAGEDDIDPRLGRGRELLMCPE